MTNCRLNAFSVASSREISSSLLPPNQIQLERNSLSIPLAASIAVSVTAKQRHKSLKIARDCKAAIGW